jgi:hypothetical protein
VLDTNFLVVPGQFKIDVAAEIRRLVPGAKLVTLSGALRELENIKGKEIAMQFIERNKVQVIESAGHVDDAILSYARANNAAVATNDAALVKRLKGANVPVVRVRQKSTLALEGHLPLTGGE